MAHVSFLPELTVRRLRQPVRQERRMLQTIRTIVVPFWLSVVIWGTPQSFSDWRPATPMFARKAPNCNVQGPAMVLPAFAQRRLPNLRAVWQESGSCGPE